MHLWKTYNISTCVCPTIPANWGNMSVPEIQCIWGVIFEANFSHTKIDKLSQERTLKIYRCTIELIFEVNFKKLTKYTSQECTSQDGSAHKDFKSGEAFYAKNQLKMFLVWSCYEDFHFKYTLQLLAVKF